MAEIVTNSALPPPTIFHTQSQGPINIRQSVNSQNPEQAGVHGGLVHTIRVALNTFPPYVLSSPRI